MIKKLDWDSDHFGMNIANLDYDPALDNLGDIKKFVKENEIKLVQCCCDVADIGFINLLERNGFYFADLKITYSIDLGKINIPKINASFADSGDILVLKKMVAKSFIGKSRYYHDYFEKNKVDELFKIWIEKSVNGEFDDFCMKIEESEAIIGFITGKKIDGLNAKIGIVGVDSNFQGRGLGAKLLEAFFYFYKSEGIKNIYVSTQGKNISANNFYIKNGFKVKSVEAWFYKKY